MRPMQTRRMRTGSFYGLELQRSSTKGSSMHCAPRRGTSGESWGTNEHIMLAARRRRGCHGMLEVLTCWSIAPDQLRGCSVVVCGENPFSCTSCSFLLELTHDVQRGRCRAHISVCERYIRDTDLRTHHLSNFGPQNPTFAEPTCHPTSRRSPDRAGPCVYRNDVIRF